MLEKNPCELELADLERLYTEWEQCDKRLFSEMRTNLQLVAGEHYIREGSRYWNRIRDSKQLTEEQKLRITKNHIQRIMKVYVNSLDSAGVAAQAKDERDMHHQKAAEMHQAVINDWSDRGDFDRKRLQWKKNFFEMGEAAVKVYWDPDEGDIVGYESMGQETPDGGFEPTIGQDGQPVVDKSRPVYGGKLCFETVPGFNLKRDPSADTMDASPGHIISKMISKSALRAKLPQEKAEEVMKGAGNEYTVFDTNTGTYRNTKDQVLFKELYIRPCKQAPKGFWYHWTSASVIDKGELPGGEYPIVFEPCEEQTGNPRGISPIRHLRPVQVELNRAASTVAEHQITIGADRLLIQANTRLTQGALLPGIRSVGYSGGKPPEVLPGRVGDQFFAYLEMQTKEMYVIADLEELTQESDAQVDIYTQLFRSMRYKRKFTIYSERFERFLKNVTKLGVCITKYSAHPSAMVPMVGKSDMVNMAEFKSMDDVSHVIKITPRSDDLETMFGQQITFNHILQYVSSSLSKEDIGKMIRLAPFANDKLAFEDLTLDYDSITNDILALDRGEYRPAKQAQDHDYALKRLTARTTKADFEMLPPEAQQMYTQRIGEHEQMKAIQLEKVKQAESEFIPSGGYLVKCDFYSSDPADPTKTKRVALPSESVAWLMKQLETQGLALNELQNMPRSVLADISDRLGQLPAGGGPMPPANQPGPGGEASPGAMNAGRNPGSNGAGKLSDVFGRYLGHAAA